MLRTLRARLTALYVLVAGGVFLTFGMAVYGLVGVLLMHQIDKTLAMAARDVWATTYLLTQEETLSNFPVDLPYTVGVVVQIWDRTGQLKGTSMEIKKYPLPLSVRGLSTSHPVYSTEHWERQTWRVLSIPVVANNRRLGTLEVGAPLTTVEQAREAVFWALVGATTLAMLLLAIVSYIGVQKALEPLAHVTALADQITHADDLSRRLAVPGGAGDEVWTLVQAFNATLARLESLFRAQRRFIADVGHELRTPLTVIKGNVQWMRRIGQLDAEALDSIEEETDRLSRLVDDLLLLARAEAGKLPLRREIVDLDAVAADVLREIQVVARGKVTLEAKIKPLQVCGDADRLKQVLLNLMSNAVKYTPKGGKVVLALEEDGEWVRCRVQDTGPGIPPEDLPHVFERFYRADKARSRGKGFGLGLSIAYWIVKHHGGRIEVTSEMGKGTTFTVHLPRPTAGGNNGDCASA